MASTGEWTDKYNPFNSMKLMTHVSRWSEIKRGEDAPSPALITIDPTNVCNLACTLCNSEYLQGISSEKLTPETLDAIADYFPNGEIIQPTEEFHRFVSRVRGGTFGSSIYWRTNC